MFGHLQAPTQGVPTQQAAATSLGARRLPGVGYAAAARPPRHAQPLPQPAQLGCGSTANRDRWPALACSSSQEQQPTAPPPPPPPHQQQQQQQSVIKVALTTTPAQVKSAILQAKQGCTVIWATGATNHFTAVQGLAAAGEAWQARQQQGLAARLLLSAQDQAVLDEQKRGLRKLQLTVAPAPPLESSLLAAGAANHVSTNRTKAVADVLALLQPLLQARDGCAVLEARGEQAVTKAVKAALALQAAAEPGGARELLLQPLPGPVVDVVAEKRGEQRTAPGLLLALRWQEL